MLTKPGPQVAHPPVSIVEGSGWAVPEAPAVEINSTDFLKAVAHAGRTLPAEVYDSLVDFVEDAPASGAMLIENMLLGNLPPTPDDPLLADKPDQISEMALLTVGRILERPVGYLPKHGGDVVQNISPTKRKGGPAGVDLE